MRILMLHADTFSFKVTGETSITKVLDPIDDSKKEGGGEEILVVFMAVEKGDASATDAIVGNTVKEISEHCAQINCTNVMIYPYAHLSASLESPRGAVRVMDGVIKSLTEREGYTISSAPFGYYKSFEVKVKGHPLSEHGRTISSDVATEEIGVSAALQNEKKMKSEWLVLTPEGDEIPIEKFKFKKHPILNKFWQYEQKGSRVSEVPPPHIRMMQEMELVDYEPGSDQGNFRWYPKGYLIKSLLERQVTDVLRKNGAMQVETPIMYSYTHPALAKYLDKFPARQYSLKSDTKEFFLRFAACFGQYLMKHDMNISHRNLPLSLYELTHYSFRREQSGELAGLRRLRTFTMPDMHTLCADIDQALVEMLHQADLCFDWMSDMEFDYAIAIRSVKDFYQANPDYARQLVKKANRPALVELWDKKYFYFVTKFEANIVDSQKKACALSTVQIDTENPEGFGISYTAESGESKTPLMLHASISGSIDRNLFALLEHQAIKMGKGQKGRFPFWLSPTQIRIIPVTEEHHDYCKKLIKQIDGRVDLDDRNETLSKRIRAAEKEWVSAIVVVGDKEIGKNSYPVRLRTEGEEQELTVEELNGYFADKMKGKVFEPLNLPQLLSLRPIFHG
jgi:threonyl-tRNA synthetase